uniref:Ras-specific guanine nucleotide-releasing factor 2 n=1 Tax=Tursiops truncatus TaxID=9739 RepID=A0A6J3R850_TURTR|nr:ras-specific guanine nucleotide-releasing factor 2 [Tursiops truncatus]
MTIVFEENSKVSVPHMIKSDARLHKDDTDICFSKTLNSCKVPQIRYASVERLLERLTDLRFLSIDFLNTFLHTYRIFTTAAVVLGKLSDIYKRPFTSIPVRSLELFFATSQNSRGEHLVDGKSPRLCRFNNTERTCDKEFIIRRTATNRVLNVLRHWVSKHAQDFELNNELKMNVLNLLEEVLRDPDLLPQERKATANILRALSQDDQDDIHLKLEDIIQLTDCPKAECFETLSAMELAEQITLLDHIVFRSIPYEEFLGQGWMKLDKNERTPYIMKTSQHFNDMSNLVASQIMNYADISSRANAIEKWVAVADICRCLHNYNGVLEITSALNRSAIYRLKKTWAKVSKQTKALMDKLQKTISSEGRFKNLRETLKNCNPPAVPYLGMYLTDLAFIEEGTPNFTEEGLVNFSKMRMISHIIREIRQFQQTSYRIDHQPKVTQYLLDKALIIDEDTLYELSLKIEPRLPA